MSASAFRNDPNVRVDSSDLRRLITFGATRSPSFRQLVDRLNTSDVIVYVRCEPPRRDLPPYNGRLSFLGAVGPTRLVVVELRCPSPDDFQVVHLAHELRHAVEIADAPEVQSPESMLSLYTRIGWAAVADQPSRRAFETEAAKQAGEAVRREIRLGQQLTDP